MGFFVLWVTMALWGSLLLEYRRLRTKRLAVELETCQGGYLTFVLEGRVKTTGYSEVLVKGFMVRIRESSIKRFSYLRPECS